MGKYPRPGRFGGEDIVEVVKVLQRHDSRLRFNDKGSEIYAYSPAWYAGSTQVTIGDGILDGQYVRVGTQTLCKIYVSVGSTTTGMGSGDWSFLVPFPAKNDIYPFVGSALASDVSVPTSYPGVTLLDAPADASYLRVYNSLPGQRNNGTRPFTWASGDTLVMQILYVAEE